MRRLKTLGVVALAVVSFTACKNADYKKSPSGIMYKLIDGGSKDSLKQGDIMKVYVKQEIKGAKDTVFMENYINGMPEYMPFQPAVPGQPAGDYNITELFSKLKKGDSLITFVYVDSLLKKGLMQEAAMPPFMKKGDRYFMTFKVADVFKNDSLVNIDRQKEGEAFQKRSEAKAKADSLAFETSGAKEKQTAQVTDYLKKKNITATKTAKGVFVKIDNPGEGAPVVDGKFVTVKYNGKHLLTDSSFQQSSFTVPIGQQGSIAGFEDGLKQFKKGGKGVIYIPGYLAYGKNPPQGSPFKEYEPLLFEVEITDVADTQPQQAPMPVQVQPEAMPKSKN